MPATEALFKQTSKRLACTPVISIVLPVYNQADHIHRVTREYCAELSRNIPGEYEILLVVNGSKDDSLAECERISQATPEVRVITSQQVGWGAAIKAGIKASSGNLICFTSSARTQSDVLASFVMQAISTPDVVLHARRAEQDNWFRSLGSRLFNAQCKTLFGIRAADVNGTPKVFPKIFSNLLTLTRDDFALDVEFDYICAKNGYPILEIPVGPTPRHGGQSTTTVSRALGLLWKTLVLRLQTAVQGN